MTWIKSDEDIPEGSIGRVEKILDNRRRRVMFPGLSTYNIKPQELRVSEVHADELQVQPPEEVVEFLRSIGREDCAVRVIEALGAAVGTTGEKSPTG